MTQPAATNRTPEPRHVEVKAEFDSTDYWLVLNLHGYSEPKIRKTDPGALGANEFALKLTLQVPKARRRVQQTIVVKFPDEDTHLGAVEVIVPEASS